MRLNDPEITEALDWVKRYEQTLPDLDDQVEFTKQHLRWLADARSALTEAE